MDGMTSLQDIVDEVDERRARDPGVRRVVIAGEFETGKSSVINALLRRTIIPCNPGLESRPFIKVKHSLDPTITAEDSVGQTYAVEEMAELAGISDLSQCTLTMPLPGMSRVEIIEIPFRHGSGISLDDFEIMADADLIIWVTIASQAWRLSEKAIMDKLPRSARGKSILAISRSDKLPTSEDWDKIETRLQKDASPYFTEIVFIQASTSNLEQAMTDDRVWAMTGGAALANIVHNAVATQRDAQPHTNQSRRSAK